MSFYALVQDMLLSYLRSIWHETFDEEQTVQFVSPQKSIQIKVKLLYTLKSTRYMFKQVLNELYS